MALQDLKGKLRNETEAQLGSSQAPLQALEKGHRGFAIYTY